MAFILQQAAFIPLQQDDVIKQAPVNKKTNKYDVCFCLQVLFEKTYSLFVTPHRCDVSVKVIHERYDYMLCL